MSGKSMKGIRKLERPRPLHLNSDQEKGSTGTLSPTDNAPLRNDTTDEEVLNELEALHISVNNGNLDKTTLSQIVHVCNLLKSRGALIESSFKEQLDCYFVTLRNASRDERLDVIDRLRLLEVIELRAMGWKSNENLEEYYKRKYIEHEISQSYDFTPLANSSSTQLAYATQPSQQASLPASASPPLSLQPTEVLKSSGKFGKPAKIPGRNFLKDEIVIRNSDSGKVMGIKGRRVHMIEELSDTVISFQRVNPGVRDRLVQITGANEDNILRAKDLIEDTIRRNASPIRDVGDEGSPNYGMVVAKENQTSSGPKPSLVHSYSMGDASMGEYTRDVSVGRDTIRINGHKEILVKTAKLVLEKYFGGQCDYANKVTVDMLSPPNRGSYVSPEPGLLSNSRSASDLGRATSWHGLASRRRSGPASSQTSSSSDEETFKDDSGDLDSSDKGVAPSPKHIVKSTSIAKSLPAQMKSVAEPPPVSRQSKVSGYMTDVAPKVDRPQVPAAASVVTADPPPSASAKKKNYSRDFLLGCARSPYATEMPPDFPSLDPDVANLMVKQHATPFDSDGFRQRMMRQASVSDFVSSSPVSSTPPRSELSELDDGSVG
ncbi:eukaryotic translation initiation factor 4E-binding protein Mextli isoform X1 [Ixodes scapularis]|uniref:eukaryotic translation initiation factor 4E-binding protein Mextli isoform X1 n=1 Tax=Ixodes scapularis TaxID=6945 RepID=UPI001A9D2D1E|nr:eukaryotic translation initiation factor 4E-binding protein Mextli isoform X1 [Ixodes scapularis]